VNCLFTKMEPLPNQSTSRKIRHRTSAVNNSSSIIIEKAPPENEVHSVK